MSSRSEELADRYVEIREARRVVAARVRREFKPEIEAKVEAEMAEAYREFANDLVASGLSVREIQDWVLRTRDWGTYKRLVSHADDADPSRALPGHEGYVFHPGGRITTPEGVEAVGEPDLYDPDRTMFPRDLISIPIERKYHEWRHQN